jgi:hypothetical protein
MTTAAVQEWRVSLIPQPGMTLAQETHMKASSAQMFDSQGGLIICYLSEEKESKGAVIVYNLAHNCEMFRRPPGE